MPVSLLITGYWRHPKMVAANSLTGGELAEVLWSRVLDHVNEHGTDGLIMRGVPELVCPRQTKKRIDALVQVGLWDEVVGGWMVHDYAEWNRTAVELNERARAKSEAKSRAGKAGAAKRWGSRLTVAEDVAHG
jgi:hypothetical protein